MYLVMWTHVRDYDDWRTVFDSGEPVRRQYGCTGHEIFRDVGDQNQLTVFLEFPSKGRAQAFLEEPRLRQKIEESGVDTPLRTALVTQSQRVDYRLRRAA